MMVRQFLVCTECRAALLARGASPVPGPRVGSILDRCEVHYGNAQVVAMHAVDALPGAIEDWRKFCEESAAPVPPPRDEVVVVSQMAAQLLALVPGPMPGDIRAAVATARDILACAKGPLP